MRLSWWILLRLGGRKGQARRVRVLLGWCALLLPPPCLADPVATVFPKQACNELRLALPPTPWHYTLIDEIARTPSNQPNAGAEWLNRLLHQALLDQATSARGAVDNPAFLSWAIWGFLSRDSQFSGDARLLHLSRTWIDHVLDSAKIHAGPRETITAHGFNGTTIDSLTLPLLEILARPNLTKAIGEPRTFRLRAFTVRLIRSWAGNDATAKLLATATTCINIPLHSMPLYVHAWLLTGERKYLRTAQRLVEILGRDQQPNGMFPYRVRLHGPLHRETEGMYYHNVNVRGLYLFWWATGSADARKILERSIPYYPLNLEPPHYFNDGPGIWWKDQWRTFWPHAAAMVAAATGDGENAAIANSMARDNAGWERVDLVLGAHAYQQMGLRSVQEGALRNNFLIVDPDIRGLRSRFNRWSSTFSTGSFGYTRTSAMLTAADGKSFTALHLARPQVRLRPLEELSAYEADVTLGRNGSEFAAAIGERVAAVTTEYVPAYTSETWNTDGSSTDWKMEELWLFTDATVLGLIASTSLRETRARELFHEFRFIPNDPSGEARRIDDRTYSIGAMAIRIWDTNFPYRVEERVRQSALAIGERRNWQLALSDMNRPSQQQAQDQHGVATPYTGFVSPTPHDYPAGYAKFSVVQVSPLATPPWLEVGHEELGPLVVLSAFDGTRHFVVVRNREATQKSFETSAPVGTVSCSSDEPSCSSRKLSDGVAITVPPNGVVLLVW